MFTCTERKKILRIVEIEVDSHVSFLHQLMIPASAKKYLVTILATTLYYIEFRLKIKYNQG